MDNKRKMTRNDIQNRDSEAEKFSFFCHKECEYFPCHATDDPGSFNCLFCYCPLYLLGEECGGNFSYTGSGIKNCSNCLVPHSKKSLANVISKFGLIKAKMEQYKKLP